MTLTSDMRAALKLAVDRARRELVTRSSVRECLWCDAPLPDDYLSDVRKFCSDRHRKRWHDSFTRTGPKFATEEERLAARRETWRKNNRNQYALYKRLLDESGEPFDRRWWEHLSELRRREAA